MIEEYIVNRLRELEDKVADLEVENSGLYSQIRIMTEDFKVILDSLELHEIQSNPKEKYFSCEADNFGNKQKKLAYDLIKLWKDKI